MKWQYIERAVDGGRTRDIQLGKLTLYQLSYNRLCFTIQYKYLTVKKTINNGDFCNYHTIFV